MSTSRAAQPGARKWLILGTMSLATVSTFMDSNGVSSALPQMQGTLGVSLEELAWVPVAAFMASMVTTIMAAWFSTLLGRRGFCSCGS